MLLNNEWVNSEIKEEIKKILETNENEHTIVQNLCEGSLEREVHSDAGIKKTETFQINSLNLHLQELEEQQQTKPRESRRKEKIKIRAELNDIETKSTILRINESRSWFFEKIKLICFKQTH